MTAALECGEWSAARPGRTLSPGKTRYPFYRRLDGPQGRSGRAENLVPTGIRYRTVQPVVTRYTDWATRPTYWVRTYLLTYSMLQSPSWEANWFAACQEIPRNSTKRWQSQLYQTVNQKYQTVTQKYQTVTESAVPNGDSEVPKGDRVSCTKRWLNSTKRWQSQLYQTVTQTYQTVTESAVPNGKSKVPNGDSEVPNGDWVNCTKRWLKSTKRWLRSTKRWQSQLYQTMTQKYRSDSAVPKGVSVRLAKDELHASKSDSNRKYVTAFIRTSLFYNNINSQLDATITNFIDKFNQLNMFRVIISPIVRRTRLCLQLVV